MDKLPSLLKLDIEGAVMEVLKDLFENKDKSHEEAKSKCSKQAELVIERLLKGNNYTCVHADGWNGCNRLYLKK